MFLPIEFYSRDCALVAKELLGSTLVRTVNGAVTRSRIVETEAYFEHADPASHAARGRTPRNAVMFGPPGRAYVYFNYGMHFLFNVVTERDGTAGAVLIRAVEPMEGVGLMLINRPVVEIANLTNGPAKLTQALAIDRTLNNHPLDNQVLGVEASTNNGFNVVSTTRIGISTGRELEYRFYIEGNGFVSRR